jgi:hypothetical protein
MKTLFFVRIYSHRLNQSVRLLTTADDEDDARQIALTGNGNGWRVERCESVCTTTDDVHREV